MSQRHPVFSAVSKMEIDIGDVGRWAELIYQLSASPNSIEPGVLHVIAAPLTSLGKRLEESWAEAFRIARGEP